MKTLTTPRPEKRIIGPPDRIALVARFSPACPYLAAQVAFTTPSLHQKLTCGPHTFALGERLRRDTEGLA
jgi:hypothetical protein